MSTRYLRRLEGILLFISFTAYLVNGATYRDRPQPTAVLSGQSAILTCAFNGLADDDIVVWQGPNDKVISSNRNVLKFYKRHSIMGDVPQGEYSLKISKVQLEDDGKYSCYIDPEATADAILTVVVPMSGPPTIAGGEVTVTAGEQLSLTCRSSGGHPSPRLTWLNGTLPFRSSIVENEEDQSLELFIPRITKWDNGANFTCVADQGFPELAKPKTASRVLRVKYPPLVQVPSPSVHVREGEPASLSCMVDSNPKAKITWRKLGDGLQPLKMVSDHVFQFSKASKRDGGLYQCEADNGVPPIGIGTFTLHVYYPPVIEGPMDDEVTMLYGQDDQSVHCIVDGNPKPHIRWRRKDTSLYWDNPLRFHRVRYDVQGTYQCVAASDGFQEVTKDVFIDVVGKPSIHGGQSTVAVAEGSTARLSCEILGDPLPGRVTWIWRNKHGVENVVMATGVGFSIVEKPVDDGISSTLFLKELGIAKEGTYICQASNMFGEARREIYLQVSVSQGSVVIVVSMVTVALGLVAAVIVCVSLKKRWICKEEKNDMSALPNKRPMPPARKPVKRLGHGTNDSGVEDLELQELDGTLKPRPPPRAGKEWTSVGLSYTGLAHGTTLPPYTTVERHRPDGEDIRARGGDIPEESSVSATEYITMEAPTPPRKDKIRRWKTRATPGDAHLRNSLHEDEGVLTQAGSI